MLVDISDAIQRFADVIAEITGIDVEIVDARMHRVAGTGGYRRKVGQSLAEEGSIYRHVMRTRRPYFLEDPRENPLCEHCPKVGTCVETLNLSTPIFDGTCVVGVIGLVCFSATARERVLASRESYMAFLARMAEVISHKLADHRRAGTEASRTESLQALLDGMGVCVLAHGADGQPAYLNPAARRALGIHAAGPLGTIGVRRTGRMQAGEEVCELTHGGRAISVVGRCINLKTIAGGTLREAMAFVPQEEAFARAVALVGEPAVPHASTVGGVPAVADGARLVLVHGEPGAGTSHVARALVEREGGGPMLTLCCAQVPARRLVPQVQALGALSAETWLVLEGVQALDGQARRELAAVLEEPGGPRVVLVESCHGPQSGDPLVACARGAVVGVPPLRERTEELPALVHALGGDWDSLDHATRQAWLAAPWPNNLHDVRRAIDGEGLPQVAHSESAGSATSPIRPLAELEREAIIGALAHHGSDTEGKKRAAKALGIGIATLYRKLSRYDIS